MYAMHRAIRRDAERGNVAAVALVLMVVIMVVAIGAGAMSMAERSNEEQRATAARARLRIAAEGVLNEAWARLNETGWEALRTNSGFPRTVRGMTLDIDITYGDTDANVNDDLIVLIATAAQNGAAAGEQLVLKSGSGPPSLLVFGDRWISLNSDAYVDSYDSTLGSHASQAGGTTSGGMPLNNSDGSVAANGDIIMDSNATVYGDANAGPTGSVTTGGSSTVTGTTGNLSSTNVLDPIVIPGTGSNLGDFKADGTASVTISGNKRYSKFEVLSDATVTVVGPANIRATEALLDSNGTIIADTTHGPVAFYFTHSVAILSNFEMYPTSGDPNDLWINFSKNDGPFLIDSNAEVTGRIYSPTSKVELKSNAQVSGSLVAWKIALDSNAGIHMDENLNLGALSAGAISRVGWRILSPAEAEGYAYP